ncbi:hypothetical protein [Flavobacterium sp.]|jgi:hypothetical protein|uniref:hypothetical protein n=1 Tax=Flavobacterium sp. TaxID=239 RepID=UPI0037C0E9A6
MKFNGQICSFDDKALYWELHIPIPESVFQQLHTEAKDKRFICTLKNEYSFHCAMLPKVTFHYILLNREVCKKLNLLLNDEIEVVLVKDESKYGMPLSEEMQEVFFSDPEGSELFHQLTPGKQRTLIHVVNKYKSSHLRIEKTFVILDHLKNRKGVLDFKGLNEDFKNFKNRF